MPAPGSFERRLLLSLALLALVPAILLIWMGSALITEMLELRASGSAFSGVAESGRTLIELAEASGSPELVSAAEAHRQELTNSLLQSGRWDYLNARLVRVIPGIGILLIGLLAWLVVRVAHRIARELARPISELVGWSRLIARGEPLPSAEPHRAAGLTEFASLRAAFREMEQELAESRAHALESERTRTWVTMARSVAHELKNSLTPLRFAARTLEPLAAREPDSREPIDVIGSETERLDALARAFSQFGRLPEGPPSEIDLTDMAHRLAATHLPANITPHIHSEPGLPEVHGHYDVLSRALVNILLNSAEAIGDGPGTIEMRLRRAGDEVQLEVTDTGPGFRDIDPEKVWDPEFTTKTRGTGLGLALVRQSVLAHGGQVGISNAEGGGARVTLRLPISRQRAATPETEERWLPS